MIEINFNNQESQIDTAMAIQAKYPQHLVLIQAGTWLHAFNQSAYLLHTLKKFKIRLAGPATKPHLMAGFPHANYSQKLWPLVNEYQIGYVIYEKNKGLTVSDHEPAALMDTITPDIVHQVIQELHDTKKLKTATTAKLLANPSTQDFIFKTKAADLDHHLAQDLFKLPRDIRSTWGENVRETMQRIMRNAYLYGNEDNKPRLLKQLSADIDLLNYYIRQAKALNRFKIAFEHRASLVVELGKIIGGLQRAQKVAA